MTEPVKQEREWETAKQHKVVQLTISWRAALSLVVLLLAPWLLVAMLAGPHLHARWLELTTPIHRPPPEYIEHCKRGPWGDVEFTRIIIGPPETFIPPMLVQLRELRWHFHGYTTNMLEALWARAQLPFADRQALMASANWDAAGAVTLAPSRGFLLGLQPEARAVIYAALAEFDDNIGQANPFAVHERDADRWFVASGLREATIAEVRRLLYRRGSSVVFSDLDIVLPDLPDDREQVLLVKTLSRVSTMLVKLRIKPETDDNALAAYWVKAGRAKDVRPLLESIPEVPGGITVDVAHLMPPLARKLLYTYPLPQSDPREVSHDCHWTSLNFFRDPPDEQFGVPDVARRVIETDYYPIYGSPTYGDMLLFVKPDGHVVHSCVYIADDIVFTKNGPGPRMPWILMSLNDLIAFYPSDPPVKVRACRARNF
jgi:hypothetical protein